MTNSKARVAPALTLSVTGLPISPSLRDRIGRRIRRALLGAQTGPIVVHVTFDDVNGPKGGLDIRCAIDVRMPRARVLHAEELADRDVLAFDRTADVITRQIAARLQRRRDSARHPKKYFAAKRLL
jgi:ribosome hibernation promoting factor